MAEASLKVATRTGFGGQSMCRALRRVLVCDPGAAGWGDDSGQWRELGFVHAPDFAAAQRQHQTLCERLEEAGAEVISLPRADGLSLDAVYVHDASFMTDQGAIVLRMGKGARHAEPEAHRRMFELLGIPVIGAIESPGVAEAGDMVWLDRATLLIGRGYRTNGAGIEQMRSLLAPHGVEVMSAPLPHGAGPSSCLHLMSLMSVLEERTILADSAWLAVETHEELKRRGFRFVEIEPSERESLACNVLALGGKRLLAFAENKNTNDTLRGAGFEVIAVAGSEIGINGGGGPTCLTRPLLRG
jgi:N-dimethylarginine dimethylaminohydrolase